MDDSFAFTSPFIGSLCAAALVILLVKIYTTYDAAARMRKLGSRPRHAPHRLPFGESCVFIRDSHSLSSTATSAVARQAKANKKE